MDFVFDYDDDYMSSQSGADSSVNLLPIPAPPLNLSNLNIYKEDLTQKFSHLNILKNLQQRQSDDSNGGATEDKTGSTDNATATEREETVLAQKYAQVSLDLIKDEDRTLKMSNYVNDAESSSNPTAVLSTRLARVLNTSNFDSGIGKALELLQLRISEQLLSVPEETVLDPSANIDNFMAIDYDSLTDTGLLGSVSRRKLKNGIENDLLRQQYHTLKNFQPMVKKLNLVKEKLDNLNKLNEQLTSTLESNSTKAHSYTSSVKELDKEKQLLTLKRQLLKNFQKKFSLTRYEEFQIVNGDIDEEYLRILTKCEQIYENCSILLSLDNPKIGHQIMTQMQELVQMLTKRILSFIKKQFQSFFIMGNNSDLDSGLKHVVFKKCLVYIIKSKPHYLSEIMDDLVASRSKTLVEEFLTQVNGYSDALESQDGKVVTSGNKRKDDSRPLMLSIYDSKRFLGDILAYLHDLIVTERELLDNLFDIEDHVISSYGEKNEGTNGETDRIAVNDIVGLVNDVILRNLNVLSKPLQSKIEQIIKSEHKLVVLQSMFQLFDLYNMMYSKLLGSKENTLLETIRSLKSLTAHRIMSVVKQKLYSIEHKNKNNQDDEHIEEIDDDLNIPEWVFEFYGTVGPLLDNLNTTDDDSGTLLSLSKEDETSFKAMVYEGVLHILDVQIAQNKLKGSLKLVFKLNSYDFISSKLITVKLFSDKWTLLNDEIVSLKKQLIDSQFQKLLVDTNLQDIYNLINMIFSLDNDYFDLAIYEPITENKMFNFKFFKEANFKLMEVLPLALMDYQQKDLAKILSPSISNEISIDSSIEFVNFYYKLWLITKNYLHVENPLDVDVNNFDRHPVFKWSDIEIATLLGCDQFYLAQKEEYKESDEE